MSDEKAKPTDEQNHDEHSEGELETQFGEQLPDREAMSLIDVNVAASVNAAVVADILASEASANANAGDDVDIDLSTNG